MASVAPNVGEGEAKFLKSLIAKVCSYKCLYDTGHISYKSKCTKDLCWAKIALECNLDDAVVKSKWKSLRDRYVREKKAEKIAEQNGTVPIRRKEWPLYKHLSFLDPYQPISTEHNHFQSVKTELDGSSSGNIEQELGGHFLDMHSYSKPTQDPKLLVVPPPPPPVRPSQPYVYILPAPVTEPVSSSNVDSGPTAKKAKISILKQSTNNVPVSTPDRRYMRCLNRRSLEDAEEYTNDEVFVLSLVPSFSKLTESRKDKLKLDMHKLVYDAVYGPN